MLFLKIGEWRILIFPFSFPLGGTLLSIVSLVSLTTKFLASIRGFTTRIHWVLILFRILGPARIAGWLLPLVWFRKLAHVIMQEYGCSSDSLPGLLLVFGRS